MVTTRITFKEKPYIRVKRHGGHYIKTWRLHRGLSVPQLSEKVGKDPSVSASMIAQLEQGRAGYTQKTLEALALALEVKPWQLLAGNPCEDNELWLAAFAQSRRGSVWHKLDEDEKPLFGKMIDTTFEAAVGAVIQLAADVFKKPLGENTKEALLND